MSIKANDLKLINSYSRKELKEEDVYIFNVTLCDNEIDRDFERFTKETLDGLCELFCGVAGILKAEGQNARIFKTWVEEVPGKMTSDRQQYYRLRARAYMVRIENNKALIDEIDSGIKKEVSVSCAIDEIRCSICGSDMKRHCCEHMKGIIYSGELCFGVLTNPTEAYEWSFVEVPRKKNVLYTDHKCEDCRCRSRNGLKHPCREGVEPPFLSNKWFKWKLLNWWQRFSDWLNWLKALDELTKSKDEDSMRDKQNEKDSINKDKSGIYCLFNGKELSQHQIIKAIEFKNYFDRLCGMDLKVTGGCLHGCKEPFDSIYECAIEYANQKAKDV